MAAIERGIKGTQTKSTRAAKKFIGARIIKRVIGAAILKKN